MPSRGCIVVIYTALKACQCEMHCASVREMHCGSTGYLAAWQRYLAAWQCGISGSVAELSGSVAKISGSAWQRYPVLFSEITDTEDAI